MFSQKDLQQIRNKGIDIDEINRQIKYFQTGFPPADITMPATPGKGIICLNEGEERHYREVFQQNGPDFHMTRFIPASGAASRMFKALFSARESMHRMTGKEQAGFVSGNEQLEEFFRNLPEYPFFEDLTLDGNETPLEILELILGEKGLNYGNKPKGLLKFHKYTGSDRRSSLEEHIREAAEYCAGRDGILRMHLTVSPDHLDGFQTEAARVVPAIEEQTGLQISLSYSFQKPETDTIAVDPENNPFRNPDGTLLFRPGGHGSLIQNLDNLESDILFISNIDNVSPDRLKSVRIHHKKVLGGVLLEIRSKLFYYLRILHSKEQIEMTRLDSMVSYLHERLGIAVPDQLENWDATEKIAWLSRSMNRPIRVCGMVRNEGEPGGGPFYVRSESGEISLQIVETSQIDMDDPEKEELVSKSTHFNPVDLVCSTRDYMGDRFSLAAFVDQDTGFISEKSVGGRPLKALERPGLWNGSMAGWLTLFVEVPVETFSPVKTIFDLMRSEHRP